MSETVYTESHEWVRYNDGLLTIGLTDFACDQLGDVVFVELPGENDAVTRGDELVVLESVKAAGEIAAPFDGVIADINAALTEAPEQVNTLEEPERWFVRLALETAPDLSDFLDAKAYRAHTGGS